MMKTKPYDDQIIIFVVEANSFFEKILGQKEVVQRTEQQGVLYHLGQLQENSQPSTEPENSTDMSRLNNEDTAEYTYLLVSRDDILHKILTYCVRYSCDIDLLNINHIYWNSFN